MHTHKSINPFIVLCCLLLVLFFNSATYGQNINICGFVIDKTTKEPLIGATVYYSENQQGTVTDNNGFFCMSVLNTKKVEFQFSFVGFQSFIHQFTLQSDTLISIELIPGISFKEIVVKTKYLTNNCNEVIEVPIKTINILPALTGEPDLLKGIQLMPGVKMGNEGHSNFYVRGGGFDQNLILLDDVTMYYVNHIGGILSVFDLNTIKKATLYKSYFPARFGGRLSSVLDIRLKDGNREKSKKKIMIGTLSSKLFMEGPLNNNVSGMFSVRRCNIDLFMRPMSRITNSGSETQIYTFYDLTGKLSYSINKRSKVISTLYSGRDKILFKEKYQNNNSYSNSFNNKWGNFLLSLKWNYVTSNNWFFESGLSYSLFFKNIINKQKQETKDANLYVESKFTSKINDIGFFSRVKKHYKLGSFQFGLKTISHFFTPSAISSVSKDKGITTDNTIFQNRVTNTEIQGFFENTLNLSEKTSIQSGIFIMGWTGLKNISIDPRINFLYNYSKNNHFNFSYSLNHQYLSFQKNIPLPEKDN
jgi:hypothetical protein